jgi:carbon starvation protein
MLTLLIAVGAFVGYVVAYHTYGRWLSKKIFNLDASATVPSRELEDGVDFVPTRKEVIFGHHFTSIAGTGPIVGPAIAVFWGWLPALLWVLLGSIFIGAVHDFGALVVSLRNRGQTVGEVAGRLISRRARVLFLVILAMALTVVLAIFGLVIASIFSEYPESVLPVWISLPIAVVIGIRVYRRGGGLLLPSLLALLVMYVAVWVGAYHLPIDIESILGVTRLGPFPNAVMIWTIVLLIYCFVASVLPVWVLLQPRDYINSHQLVLALGLLLLGVVVSGSTGQADLLASAPAISDDIPVDAPPIWPFLFITIACGAVSGFHCLVSSGTTSKQLQNETDAQYVGYGAMLLEGGLAVIVILACCAGVGMGKFARVGQGAEYTYSPVMVTATRLQRYVLQELAGTFGIAPLTNKYAATALAVGLGGVVAMIPAGKLGPGSGGLILWPLFGAINQLLAGLAFMVTAFYLWRRNKPVVFVVVPMIVMLIMPAWAMLWNIFHDGGWLDTGDSLLLVFGAATLLVQSWMMVEGILLWPKVRGVLEEQLP